MIAALHEALLAMPLTEVEWRPKMERYVRGGQWQRAVSLLKSVREAGGEVGPGGFQAAITACARAEPPAWRSALQVLAECREADAATPKVFGAAINACRTEWRTALDLLSQMRDDGIDLNPVVATTAVKAVGDAGEWRKALEIFVECVDEASESFIVDEEGTSKTCVDHFLLQATMMACAAAGRVEETRSLLQYVPQDAPGAPRQAVPGFDRSGAKRVADDAFDHSFVVACANADQLNEGLDVLHARVKRGAVVSPNSFHALLRGARASGNVEDSLMILEEMIKAGLQPTDASYYLGLSPALTRDASWRSALRLISRLLATHDPPSEHCQASLLAKCAEGEQPEAAEALLMLLYECGAMSPKAVPRLCERALDACAKGRSSEAAVRILNLLEEAAKEVDAKYEPLRPIAYASAINACPAYSWQTAKHIWGRMITNKVTPDFKCGAAGMRAMRRGARWKESLGLLRCLDRRHGVELNTELLGECVSACEGAGQWGPALRTLRAIPINERSKRKERALALLAGVCELNAPCMKMWGFSGAASSMTQPPPFAKGGGAGGDAAVMAVSAEVAAVVVEGGAFDLDDVHAALGLTALGGQWEDALQLMRSLGGIENVGTPGTPPPSSSSTRPTGMRVRLGLRPEPMTFSLLISAAEKGSQWQLLLRLHSALSRDGMWSRFGLENKAGYDAVATQAAVNAHCALDDWASAASLLEKMEDFGLRPSRETCEKVLSCMSRSYGPQAAGACDAASNLLQRMLDEGPAPSRAGFESVIHALARRFRSEECIRMMGTMAQVGDLPVEMSTLAAAFSGILAAARGRGGRSESGGGRGGGRRSGGRGSGGRVVVDRRESQVRLHVHRVHSYAMEVGLLPQVSSSLVDVRRLPMPVAVGRVVGTLESLRNSDEDPAALINGPLTIRTDFDRTEYRIRQAITKYCRASEGRRAPMVTTTPPRQPKREAEGEEEEAEDPLIGRELVLPERSLRNWLRASRRTDKKPAGGKGKRPASSRGGGLSSPYWEEDNLSSKSKPASKKE